MLSRGFRGSQPRPPHIHSCKAWLLPIRAASTQPSTPADALYIVGPSGQKWEPVIGLEVHAQLNSQTKLFSSALSSSSASPNTNVSTIDAAFPGTLPRLNGACVRLGVTTALALSSTVQLRSSFDRKHYFYGDLPQGYQITQLFEPIARGGQLAIGKMDGLPYAKTVEIQQIQIEQDSGKSVQGLTEGQTLVDLNRAGVGVLEIITEPDLRSSTETVTFLKKLQRLLWYINVSASEMDEGAWRCDVNVSVRPAGGPLGARTEIKHLVKFTSIKSAIEHEIDRQIEVLESGKQVAQETRGYDVHRGTTFKLRSKEESQDYRYMPEPDLPQILLSQTYIDDVAKSLPEPLDTRRNRLMAEYSLTHYQVEVLMDEPDAVEYFEQVAHRRSGKKAANWVIGELFGWLKMRNLRLRESPVEPHRLGTLLDLVESGSLSGLRAKDALHMMVDGDARDPTAIATEKGWVQNNDQNELEQLCDDLIAQHPDIADRVRGGKDRLIKFFVGEVMKQTKGKSNPVIVAGIFRDKLLSSK
ncbi:hypothetical protein PhCBS80983_g03015 [Powellomyces hirtus]|uniref:Glutamyl-tRNA(Gln) amidotransferase subunit B, mitochondrial n=1 Tax=Powellomyces hirtus TaxID=109895 RepID=A0A507E4D6_9FUNG|nr:hypothetical protein PhCBS80983_g03015 [Powellomyces hirtus]